MSTILRQHFELSNGTTITPANSAAAPSNQLDAVQMSNTALTYSTDQKAHGSTSLKVVASGSSATGQVKWTTSLGTPGRFAWEVYVYLTAFPSAPMNIVYGHASDGTSLNLLNVGPSGAVSFSIDFADGSRLSYSLPGAITANSWWRFEGTAVLSAGTGGSLLVNSYALDSMTVANTLNPTAIKTIGTAGATLDLLQFGKNTTAPTIAAYYLDDVGFQDSTTLLGPYTSAAPTVRASGSLAGSALTLVATPTTYDGTVSAYAWTQTAGPTLTLSSTTAASPTATVTTAGTYSFSVQITDDIGRTATSTASVTYVGTSTAPATTGTGYTNRWVEAVVGVPTAAGTMSYSISPSAGVTQVAPGVFTGPMPPTATAYTVTATESGNANTTPFSFVVPGASTPSGSFRILLANADQSAGGTFS